MSLQVWLPLNRDLRDQGLTGVNVTNNGATLSNYAYSFDGSSQYIQYTGLDMSGAEEITVACWVKPTNATLDGLFSISRNNTWQFGIAYAAKDNTDNCLIVRDKSTGLTSPYKNFSIGEVIANEWMHLVCIYNKGIAKIYKNGVLYSKNLVGGPTLNDHNGTDWLNNYWVGKSGVSTDYFSGSVFDFRLYDHALSDKEVMELSRGCIMHYPCSEVNENIIESIDYANNIKVLNDNTIQYDPFKGLKFKSNGNSTISINNVGNNSFDIWYSKNSADNWVQWTSGNISLADTDFVYFKGNNPNGVSISSSKYSQFVISSDGSIEISGNIMSLIDNGTCNTYEIPNNYCFYKLFYNCDKIINAPELPAQILKDWCYAYLFYGCKLLQNAPELPSITLQNHCYCYMFGNCISLQNAPKLPSIVLAESCYAYMFYNCISLKTAPELWGVTLTPACYTGMFKGCYKLNYIKCLARDLSASNCLYNWVDDVAPIGTFIKWQNIVWPENSTSGIPKDWESHIEFEEYLNQYLTFEAVEDNCEIKFYCNKANEAFYKTIEVSTDGTNWTSKTSSNANIGTVIATINKGTKLYLRGDNAQYSNYNLNDASVNYVNSFYTNKQVYLYGNIMSLISSTNFSTLTTLTENANFEYMFYVDSISTSYANNILSHPEHELVLPATTVTSFCYFYTLAFTGISRTPKVLPAYTIEGWSYMGLFRDCAAITEPPKILTTNAPQYSFQYTFLHCTSLKYAPTLYVTSTAVHSFLSTFNGCTSVTTIPYLPATTLTSNVYSSMFANCTSLVNLSNIVLPAHTLVTKCYDNMFSGCTNLQSAPILAATTLASQCYKTIFQNCTNLNHLECYATTNINTTNCQNWCDGVQTTKGIFIKAPNATWGTGTSAIPTNWLTQDDTAIYNPTETFTPAGYITFKIYEDNTLFGLARKGSNHTLHISKDTEHWMVMTISNPILLNNGDVVYVCGNLTANNSSNDYTQFAIYGKTEIIGNCNAIWNKDDLDASLKEYCGYRLFNKCNIISAPELPATTLVPNCYDSMFIDCKQLTTAPILKAASLINSCYNQMFYRCTSLNYVCCFAKNNIESNCSNWLYNVSNKGIFAKNKNAEWPNGTSGIPSNWEIHSDNMIIINIPNNLISNAFYEIKLNKELNVSSTHVNRYKFEFNIEVNSDYDDYPSYIDFNIGNIQNNIITIPDDLDIDTDINKASIKISNMNISQVSASEFKFLYDKSGFENHSTITGFLPLELDNSVPRYDKCMNVDNASNSNRATCTIKAPQVRAASFWLYLDRDDFPTRDIVFIDGISKICFGFYNDYVICHRGSSAEQILCGFYVSSKMKLHVWNHIVVNHFNTYCQLWVNGEEILNPFNEFYNSDAMFTLGGRTNNSYFANPYTGKLSDFRLFTKALTQQDVDDLYKDTVSIDNFQNIHTYELNELDENSTIKIQKNGDFLCNEFSEEFTIEDALYLPAGTYVDTELYYASNDKCTAETYIKYDENGSGRDLMGYSDRWDGYWGVTSAGAWEVRHFTYTDADITKYNKISYEYTGNLGNLDYGTYMVGCLCGSFSVRNKTIYNVKLWKNNILERDLYPCIINNRCGLVDILNETFYPVQKLNEYASNPKIIKNKVDVKLCANGFVQTNELYEI